MGSYCPSCKSMNKSKTECCRKCGNLDIKYIPVKIEHLENHENFFGGYVLLRLVGKLDGKDIQGEPYKYELGD